MSARMAIRQLRRRLLLLALSAAVLAACEQLATFIPSPAAPPAPTAADADMPGPGQLHLTAVPEEASVELVIRYVRDGDPSRVEDRVPAGAPVLIERTTLPHPRERLEVDGAICDGTYPIEALMETDVVVIVDDAGCRVEVRRIHAAIEGVHGVTAGIVYGRAGSGAVVRLRPIAEGSGARSMETDPDGGFRFLDLLAGTYELTVVRDNQVIETRTIELDSLGEVYLELGQPPEHPQ